MVSLNILKKDSCGAYTSPTFIMTELNGTVRMVLDYRKLNMNLIGKPYPFQKNILNYTSSGIIPTRNSFRLKYRLLYHMLGPRITRCVYNHNPEINI